MSYYDKAKNRYDMLAQGKILDAFDKYYHKDIVMIKEFNGSGVNEINSNEKNGTTIVESWMDVTLNDGNRTKMEEVAVQKWQGDQIINERFYYNAAK
jgi:hypothetical protein